jgi:hypothetical protein
MSGIQMAGPVAYLENSGSAVYFSRGSAFAGTTKTNKGTEGTTLLIKRLQNQIDVAFWGEDNRFPNNIEQQMAYCGVGKSGLDWKARALWGNGIVPGKLVGIDPQTKEDIFEPLDRTKYKDVYEFIENRSMFRFWIEYLQDWVWYFNCFPEVILSKDAKTITGLVHQESCDSRFKQMDLKGQFPTVFLSKLWGASGDQFAKFDPTKTMRGLLQNPQQLLQVDNIYVKGLDAIDMYDALNSLTAIGMKKAGGSGLNSAILPVNYPSVNKTYYQVPFWDGARLGGWVEIASKIPSLIKTLYNKAFRIKYHIEVPESYFPKKYGVEAWDSMTEPQQTEKRKTLLKEMDDFLTGEENAFKSFVSFFEIATTDKKEYGSVKITVIEDKSNIDKDLITGSAADIQVLVSMGINPTLFGAVTIGTGQQRSGGSDIREAFLLYSASLNLERQVMLEPLYLVRDYNREVGGMAEWEADIQFRVRDTILRTLDTGAGTSKTLS